MHDFTLPRADIPAAQRHRLTLLTLCLAVLIAQVDTAIVNLAIHPIGAYFRAQVGALQWVMDGYNLVYAGLLLSGGLIADLKGRRLIFMAGAGVFTGASLLCAAAPSIGTLIAGRALAGVGAALLIPASLAIIRVAWPDPAARGRALGIWAGCNGLAFAIAPALGGALVDEFGWRSVFFVVVPLGLAALLLAPIAITESADPGDRHFDAVAQILGIVALGGFALAAIQAQTAPMLALVVLVAALGALAGFIAIEARRGASALVPLDLFRIGTFRGAFMATTGMTFGMYGTLFLLPLTWQSTGRFGATGAGLALLPMALVFVFLSPFSGVLTERFGARVTTGGGVGIIGIGLLTIGLGAGWPSLLPTEIGLALTGLGMGLATGPLMGVAVGAVAGARAGTAASLINAARMVGATIGVAVLGAIFARLGSGQEGLRIAMVCGGLVQIVAATAAWRSVMPPRSALTSDRTRPG